MVQPVRWTIPQLLHKVIDVRVCRSCRSFTSVSLRRGGFPWSRLFVGPQLLPLLDTVFDVPAAQVVQDFVVVQRQIPMVLVFSRPRNSPVARGQGDRCPCCAVRASSLCRRGGDSRLGVSAASCGMKLALGSGRALCTGTGPGFDPRHQGGEGVAGSPGV